MFINYRHRNIVDSLLSMLEKYTSTLEETIAERTHNLLHEKRRAEEILYSILPRCVIPIFS
jgi:hypothetical protein